MRIPSTLATFTLLVTAATLGATGCSVNAAAGTETTSNANVDLQTTRQKMVGGTISNVAQDATVFLAMADSSCSGSLIAENLVLTARHCVAEPQESQTTDCVPYGQNVQASSIQIKLGVGASFNSPTAARGSKIFVSSTSNMCSFDVALVQLDQPIAGAKLAALRFTDLQANEQGIAVGYGVDGNDRELPNRMQRQTNVLGVGPTVVNYQTKQNTTLTYNLPDGDVATGESTCFGDSGGPLLDMQGRIIAITSRGIDDGGEKGHGNTCIDEPSIYAGVKFNENLIRQAAIAAGHPLPANEGGGTKPNNTPRNPTGDDTGSDDADDEGDDGVGGNGGGNNNGGDEEDEKPVKKKKSAAVAQAGGCSASPSSSSNNNTTILLLAVGGLLIAARRRRS